ncbi:unnamed protein product [Rotaria magnacalcarata]|uniref:CCDC113/CCDC96 coiled-coil domain-containing protein n=1 Tax=Rotaria magnacalcarata TaxID=392030 RepID=A0A816YMS6_9BILA|nr:unnamed protein product [Rotaria magnacalcarata]CAF2162124.1 unnamed protein product [Rotaria magnacalcarata]
MSMDLVHRQETSNTIAAIIDGYVNNIYNEHEKEDLRISTIPILQKKLKKINEQLIFLHAENRLLLNYLIWFEKKIIRNSDHEKRVSDNILLTNELKSFPHQILNHKTKQILSIQKKREIAETTFKVLLGYSQKYSKNATQYVDECINTIETDNETIVYVEFELIALQRFIQKMHQNLRNTQKQFTAEEFFAYIYDRIRYRKRQKTVRLHFHIDSMEKSIRKIHQVVDAVTDVDFEQLKIDIEKQLKELNMKNKMLIFYKRQQSEANLKLNAKKPELFKEIRALTSIRNEINKAIQQLSRYHELKCKMQDEILEYEKINDPLREMTRSYRVPSIINYVDLKSKQISLYRQIHTWERKVQIAERELHLRQMESMNYPEKIIHPWKYLQNPSPTLFYQRYKISGDRANEQNEIDNTIEKKNLNRSLPKLNNKKSSIFTII